MGSGFRTFTAGEVLTASNVQNYLMDQSVMVFGGSAARSSAIGTANFEEGMVSYLTDTDKVEAYNGTNWVSVAPTTSQGLTLINTTSFSGVTSISVNDVFSATYERYLILPNLKGTLNGKLNMRLRVSGSDNSSTNYRQQVINPSLANINPGRETGQTRWQIGRMNGDTTQYTYTRTEIQNPFETENTTGFSMWSDATTGNIDFGIGSLGLDVTTSYTGFTLLAENGNMTGNVRVYGHSE